MGLLTRREVKMAGYWPGFFFYSRTITNSPPVA